MPRAEEAVKKVPSNRTGKRITELAEEIVAFQESAKMLKTQIDTRKSELFELMEAINDGKAVAVKGPGFTVSLVLPLPRKTLVPEKLIDQGVSMAVIERATVLTAVKPHVRVAAEVENDDGE